MGHEYTTLNTYINNGKRSCKECTKIKSKEYEKTRKRRKNEKN